MRIAIALQKYSLIMLFGEYPQKSVVDAAVKFSPQAIEVGHIFRIGADQRPLPHGRVPTAWDAIIKDYRQPQAIAPNGLRLFLR